MTSRSACLLRVSAARAALLAAACAATVATAQPAAPPSGRLPQRNLVVEVRQGEASRFEARGAALESGAVTVGPDGRVDARAGVTVGSRQVDDARDATQQLRVLNGAQGMLHVGASVPLAWYEVVSTPDGPGLIAGQHLVDTGRMVAVRPSWPGGNAPVTVEVRTEASALATGGVPSRYDFRGAPQADGAIERSGLLTTLQLPLGAWVTVAGEGSSAQRSERGVLSTAEIARERRHVVQMRVTAP